MYGIFKGKEGTVSALKVMENFARMSFCIIFAFDQISPTCPKKCTLYEIRESRYNRRCMTAEKCLANLTTSRHLCTLTCLQRPNCSLTYYNYVHNYCFLANGKSAKLEKDVTYFGATGEGCLSWAALSDYKEAQIVILHPRGAAMAPGPYVLTSPDVVLGKIYPQNNMLSGYTRYIIAPSSSIKPMQEKYFTFHRNVTWPGWITEGEKIFQRAPLWVVIYLSGVVLAVLYQWPLLLTWFNFNPNMDK